MAVKRVGFFREVPAGERVRGLPSIRDSVCPTAQPDEDRLVNYLKAGACVMAAGDYTADVLNPAAGFVTGASNYLTDGAWVWPAQLAYYVANYHLALPDAFVADARRNGWAVPVPDRAAKDAVIEEIVTAWRAAEKEAEPAAAPDPAM